MRGVRGSTPASRSSRAQCAAWRSSAAASCRNTSRRCVVGVLGEPAEQRAAVDLVGVHLAEPLRRARRALGRHGDRRRRHGRFTRSPTRVRGSVADFPEAQALRWRRPVRPRCGRGARRMPEDRRRGGSCRCRRRRACRRSSAPSASRTRWRGSRSAARRRRGRASCDSSTRRIGGRALRALAAERGEVVLAEERVGAEAQQRRGRAAPAPTTRPGEERVGHRAVHDRVAVRAPRAPSGGRRSRASTSSASRTTTSGPSWRVDRALRPVDGSTSPATGDRAHHLAPRVHAGVGAARARERRRVVARSTCASASRSTPSTVRMLGLRGEPVEVGAVVRDDVELAATGPRSRVDALRERRAGVTPVRCAPWARCRRGAGRASGCAGSRPGGRRSAARSRRTACG